MTGLGWYLLACALVSLWTLAFTLRNLRALRPPPQGDPRDTTLVSVCIPCRNEERNLEEAARCVLASHHAHLEVLVYDDESTDRTPEILRTLIASDPRVRAVPSHPLPAGWVGKQHACHRLAEASRGEWLLFIDADVRLETEALGRALAFARAAQAPLVSTFPRQITATPGEALIVPMMFYLLLGYLPFRRMRRSLSPAASAACGQFILAQHTAYLASGGHAAIKSSMHDGVKLPRLFRKAGHRTDLFDGTSLCRVRMYTGLAQTWRGFAKNAYEGLGSMGLLLFLSALHLAVHLAPWAFFPVLILLGASPVAIALAAAAMLLQIAQRLLLTVRFAHSPALVPLHPVSIALLMGVQWHSYILHRRQGRSWKGRTMTAAASEPEELVVLVDESDHPIGTMEKQAAHEHGGTLHRAFSVFVLDDHGRLLLQKRARTKYHFGGLWTNTCCSHPRPGEDTTQAAQRRLKEEMGLDLTLEHRGSFLYKAHDESSGLTEHELDHVYVGHLKGEPRPSPEEAEGWRWITMDALRAELAASPSQFTPWFSFALSELREFNAESNDITHGVGRRVEGPPLPH